jgi:hypothetical protein
MDSHQNRRRSCLYQGVLCLIPPLAGTFERGGRDKITCTTDADGSLIFPAPQSSNTSLMVENTYCRLDRYYAPDLFRGRSAWFSFGLLKVRGPFFLMLQKIGEDAETYRRIGIAEATRPPSNDVVLRKVTIV